MKTAAAAASAERTPKRDAKKSFESRREKAFRRDERKIEKGRGR